MATKDFNTATLTAKFNNYELTTANAVTYAVPASRCAKIQTLSACNRHTSAVTVDIYVVPNGASILARHLIVSAISLAAGETVSFEAVFEGLMLGENDAIQAKASVASVVSIFISCAEGA